MKTGKADEPAMAEAPPSIVAAASSPSGEAASPEGFFGRVFRLLGGAETNATAQAKVFAKAAGEEAPLAPFAHDLTPLATSPSATSSSEPTSPEATTTEAVATCPACGEPLADGESCGECGFVSAPAALAKPIAGGPAALEIGAVVAGRFEIVEERKRQGAVNVYLAKSLADDRLVVLKEASDAGDAEANDAADGDAEEKLPPSLERERNLLASIRYPSIPKLLDAFRSDNRSYLAHEFLAARRLREAWSDAETTDTQRVDWLIQLCQALAKLHAMGVVYNAVAPDRLAVDERGRLVLPDVSSAARLPIAGGPVDGTRYTAPELVLGEADADSRADLYSFGACWYSLLVGRELADEDFEAEFAPRLDPTFLDACHPLLSRLLLKTFARDPNRRFPTEEERDRGTLAATELQRHLLAYKRRLTQPALEVGAQTSIGVARTANEDNFFALQGCWKSGDESIAVALLVLADGMGGAAAGELASEIAVGAVREALAPRLFEWVGLSPEEQRRYASAAIGEAIQQANAAVSRRSAEHSEFQGMACTLDVAVVLGAQAIVGHVGDSRVGIVRREGVTWLTEDQTLVSRLVKLRLVSEEEAETHPDRSKLLQAIGGGKTVEPALCLAELRRGDRLLCCSDGLTGHVDDGRISEIVLAAPSAQTACDRAVNEANRNGGSDNVTVLIAAIV